MLSCTGTARKRSLDHLDRTRKRIGQGKAAIGEAIKQSRSKPVSRKARLLDVGGRNPARHRLSGGGNRNRTIGSAGEGPDASCVGSLSLRLSVGGNQPEAIGRVTRDRWFESVP